ncbi:ADP-ribosylglycohydrolase family protein [Xanthocytophaga flava]|uniref:ADP-ribosylglycohydrolase family protein n=1 Tax=Xanthocytophaga flava TaxID=3048013 RepID=UPI0028D6DF9E|nr:ADP-ribosylglycohydrolase family protein [Xanthocytophaga flavus]MDJ1473519.1 ADP-ribosylglycohydrolase family protein [Xanthocytophaga flavus]
MSQRNFAREILFGVAVGDALGVPVEFQERIELHTNPVTGMIGYGSHNQPSGTWSDDSSLTFCLAESLCKGYDLNDLGRRFINWREMDYWTPHGNVFDIGFATSDAISDLIRGVNPLQAGRSDERSNGNGSLMRILPLLLHIKDMPIEKRYQYTKEVSSVTHAHIRSVIACFIYLEYARQIIEGKEKFEAFEITKNLVNDFLQSQAVCRQEEIDKFHSILMNPVSNYEIKPIYEYGENEISSSGYVLSSLEASFWCLLNSNSYSETVLKAVNLGSDTDTTGAIVGGLASLLYGFEQIPKSWIAELARRQDIEDLAMRLHKKYNGIS